MVEEGQNFQIVATVELSRSARYELVEDVFEDSDGLGTDPSI